MENEEPNSAENAFLILCESKKKQFCDFGRFVKSYFPIKEESWNYAIPLIGFILSCFSILIILAFLFPLPGWLDGLFGCAYLAVAAAFSIELYFSLKQQKSKQHYALWLLLKTIEVFLLGIVVMIAILFVSADIDIGFSILVLLILDLLALRYVIKRSSKDTEEPTMEAGNKIANMIEYSKIDIH